MYANRYSNVTNDETKTTRYRFPPVLDGGVEESIFF